MGNASKSFNDIAWERLFEKYGILERINIDGEFQISAAQIKEFREPRLMAKFDHAINLPRIFAKNKLSILPITRGDYVISHFDAYHRFEADDSSVTRLSLPTHIQSLDCNNISSEAIALNCAVAAGVVADFLEDEKLVATVSGRMGSGAFGFNIFNTALGKHINIRVNNSQIEIDAAYEGVRSLALFEAKRDLSDDFLIRQLYYPYRVWEKRITKPVRPIFLVYSNGIYRLYEYKFEEPNNYNSPVLVKQKKYSIEDTAINVADIQTLLLTVKDIGEPEIPFPQADSMERIINLCELLDGQELSRSDVIEEYAFDARQTNYYTDAARYLGLIEKKKEGASPVYMLSEKGSRILHMNYKPRQLAYCDCILSHKVFRDTLDKYFKIGCMPATDDIVGIMKRADLYNVTSESTYRRRSSTVRGWINWIINRIH